MQRKGDIKVATNNNNISLAEKNVVTYKKKKLWPRIVKYRYFYLMFLPVFLMNLLFKYWPMLGIRFAFTKLTPFAPAKYIGFKNFENLFKDLRFTRAFSNTIYLSLINLILATVISIAFALLMNELRSKLFKSFTQTVLFLPHFISWVVTASIFYLMLSPSNGFINGILGCFGIKAKYFMIDEKMWTPIFLFANRWKETGWNTIIYFAALAGISEDLYEAAEIDGAGRVKQTWFITLPGIMNTILVVFILNLAKVLNLFESALVFSNASVMNVSDTIQYYAYRLGLQQSDYGYSTAVGLFKSVIAMLLVLISNVFSKKVKGSGII